MYFGAMMVKAATSGAGRMYRQNRVRMRLCIAWAWQQVITIVMGIWIFYFSNMVRSMVLLQNQGDGTFHNVAETAGVDYMTGSAVGWGTAFFDYDNDGRLDLYLAASGISPIYGKAGMHNKYPDMLYHNNGDGTFDAVLRGLFMGALYPTMGFSTADYNHDGLVDFVATHWNDRHRLYENTGYNSQANNWIAFRLEGKWEHCTGCDWDAHLAVYR